MQSSSSSGTDWSYDDIDFKRLDQISTTIEFDCGEDEQNEYLHKYALDDQRLQISTTYILYYKEQLIGFVTLTMDEIPLANYERPEGVRFSALPALKAAQLGTDKRFAGRGFGKMLVTFAISKAKKLSDEVGCRFVTLDSKPIRKSWYEKQGFVENKLDQKQREEKRPNDPNLAISMRFDLKGLD